MNTFHIKLSEIEKKWLIIDAENLVLGRLAADISQRLRGKNKGFYTPSADCGDNIVVINAEKVALSGKKKDRKDGKLVYKHTGFPGGLKTTTTGKMLEGKNPEHVLKLAVRGMMPKTTLGNQQLKNLYIYAGKEHKHEAQKPEPLNFASLNTKNKR